MTPKKAILFSIYFLVGLAFLFVLMRGIVSLDRQTTLPSNKSGHTEDTLIKKVNTTVTSIGNITLSDIQNITYETEADDIVLNEGVSEDGCIQLKEYSFGDVNKDGNGDAVVLLKATSQCVLTTTERLYVVVNQNGIFKTVLVFLPIPNEGSFIYKTPIIKNGSIFVDVSFDKGITFSVFEFQFKDGVLASPINTVRLKNYINEEFKFKFKYPEGVFVSERPIIESGKNLKESLMVSLSLPFLESFNTWKEKGVNFFIKPGVCPIRASSKLEERNGIEFYKYNPDITETSDVVSIEKKREYMTYKAPFCFITILSIKGIGPKHPSFPKPEVLTAPENEELFLKLEMVSLEQIFDTFSFIK